MHWAIWDAMFKAQNAIEGVISNFPNRAIAAVMWRVVFPLGRPYEVPSDQLGHDVAKILLEPSAARDRLAGGMFIGDPDEPVGLLERALGFTIEAEPLERKLKDAQRERKIDARLAPGEDASRLVERAVAAGILTPSEAAVLAAQRELAARVVRVDDFAQDLGTSLLAQDRADFGRPPITAPAPANLAQRRAVANEGFR